jgi:hypothetical protein
MYDGRIGGHTLFIWEYRCCWMNCESHDSWSVMANVHNHYAHCPFNAHNEHKSNARLCTCVFPFYAFNACCTRAPVVTQLLWNCSPTYSCSTHTRWLLTRTSISRSAAAVHGIHWTLSMGMYSLNVCVFALWSACLASTHKYSRQ